MANVGTFKKSEQEFLCEIVTLSVQTKGVRFVPETGRSGDRAPSRIHVGRAEIGASWSKRSSEGRDYLSVKLDDQSFDASIYASLIMAEPNYSFRVTGQKKYYSIVSIKALMGGFGANRRLQTPHRDGAARRG